MEDVKEKHLINEGLNKPKQVTNTYLFVLGTIVTNNSIYTETVTMKRHTYFPLWVYYN